VEADLDAAEKRFAAAKERAQTRSIFDKLTRGSCASRTVLTSLFELRTETNKQKGFSLRPALLLFRLSALRHLENRCLPQIKMNRALRFAFQRTSVLYVSDYALRVLERGLPSAEPSIRKLRRLNFAEIRRERNPSVFLALPSLW
jgi:hypothetical protein